MMADAKGVFDDPPPEQTTDYDCVLSVPPLDTAFFSQQLIDDDGGIGDGVDFDFDVSFDDLYIPTADELDDLLNPAQFPEFGSHLGYGADFPQFAANEDQFDAALKQSCSEFCHGSGDGVFACDHSSDGSGILNSASSGLESHQISGFLNVPSPESGGSNREASENCGDGVKMADCTSPESRASENCGDGVKMADCTSPESRASENCGDGVKMADCASPESRASENCSSNVSEESNDHAARSVSSSPSMNNRSNRVGVVSQKVKFEEPPKNNALKRKKDREDLPNITVESRIKHRKSNCNLENNDNNGEVSDDDEKRKARLIRNRESAQLSRQRKKHYVEELEEKVKMMQSTIQDLNVKISCFMAENATLRQQMGGGGAVPPPPMAPPPPGMYPHPAMMYPWMPYPPPYMVKPQGSQVPLVPIPRLKPQQTSQTPKISKKAESKKNAMPKTKKVAGISFLGLLFFVMLFGVLVPTVNIRFGGVRETLTGGERYVGGVSYEKRHGRVLMVNGSEADGKFGKSSLHCGHNSGGRSCNESEPLVASLYVPRNDKLVKIDGNLIIHSVLASEKATTNHKIVGGETGLAVAGGLVPSNPVSGRNGVRLPQIPALGSSSVNKDSRQASDGRIQEWFREGLSGPMLSSGMCTEVFQFDVSPASSASGAIISASHSRNISDGQNHNSTHLSKGRYRRILDGLPIQLPESSHNISRQHKGRNPQKENLKGNNSVSSMVVSVLIDPREEGDVDGVMGKKSLPQIFVVVLIDSVKYVTYSCMLPFKGSALHLAAA